MSPKNKRNNFSDDGFLNDEYMNSVAMSNEMTGAMPVVDPEDDAVEIYEQVYNEFYGMPIGNKKDDSDKKKRK